MSNIEKENIDEIKVIVLGDSGVGKTNLINTSIGLEFIGNNSSTISCSSISKQFIINDEKYNINIWDTAGQEKYRGLTKLFFKGSEIVILVYDITNYSTFKSLDYWFQMCEDIISENHIYGIVGNKIDLLLNEKVCEEDGKKFAEAKNAKFTIVSAKNDSDKFVEFIKGLIIEYKKIPNIERRDSIVLNQNVQNVEKKNKKKMKNEKKKCGCK